MTRPRRSPRLRAHALVLLAPLLFLAAGCAGSREESGADPGVPADFRLVFGSGGGFTGLWEGYAVEADGGLTAWSRTPGKAEERKDAGRLAPKELTRLWQAVQDHGFFDLPPGEPGNMTRMIRVTAEGRTHEVSWTPEMGQGEPSPLDRLYRRCLAATGEDEG